jgi:SulP family sulfate permease
MAAKTDESAPAPTPEQLQSVRGTLLSPRRLKTEVLAGLVVALALIPEAIAFSIIAAVDPGSGSSPRSRWQSPSPSSAAGPR